jgi:hypothetical protein
MQYPTLDRSTAQRALDVLQMGEPVDFAELTRQKGTGEPLDLELVNDLVRELMELKVGLDHIRGTSGWGKRFDTSAAAIVHRWAVETGLRPEVLADQGFWRWLAISKTYELITWRYMDGKGMLSNENFGTRGTRQNALFRLFQIGDLSFEPNSQDPYELASVGDVDFWVSHILRQNYANARPVARALIDLQAGRLNGLSSLTTGEIRYLAKDLKRLRENLVFEVLSHDEARQLVAERAKIARARISDTKTQKDEVAQGGDSAAIRARSATNSKRTASQRGKPKKQRSRR